MTVKEYVIKDVEFPADSEDEFSEAWKADNVPHFEEGSSLPPARKKLTRKATRTVNATKKSTLDGKSHGRLRYADGHCQFHGPSKYGEPCSKFSHVRPDGKGPYQPGLYRFFVLQAEIAVKPVFFLLILVFAYLILTGKVSVPGISFFHIL